MPIETLSCPSRVERVVVYARGAMVTRRVELPERLPEAELELRVPGLTPFAEPGAIRVEPRGARRVTGVRARLVVPERAEGGGEARERVRRLERERRALQARLADLARRRQGLLEIRPRLALHGRSRKADPAARVGDALALDGMIDGLAGDLDTRLLELEHALEQNARLLASAHADLDHAGETERAVAGHPTREVLVTLAADAARLEGLELTYPVAPARWWAAYSARIATGGKSAELALEAFVAQASLEDWGEVRIGLCTADMVQDIRLPELPSLRLGRAQPAKRSGFREPPQGLEALFASYDGSLSATAAPAGSVTAELAVLHDLRAEPSRDLVCDEVCDDDVCAAKEEEEEGCCELEEAIALPCASAAPMPPPSPRRVARPGAAPEKMKKASRARMDSPSFGGAPPAEAARGGALAPPEAEPADDPGEWLDFDGLRLAGDREPRRGRLVRRGESLAGALGDALRRVDSTPAPVHSRDPLLARGSFDHRFDAQGRVDVTANGKLHRLTLRSAEAPMRQRFRTVPRESSDVYREATLTNPFAAPLLAGPIDVFLDGALMTTSALGTVDRGGELSLGLGVEERIRVARNARTEESAKGVLGGTTAVDHHVSIEASSALGHEVELEVLDRVPVSDDKDVETTLLAAKPAAERYDQAERGHPVRGGRRWRLRLGPGGRAEIHFTYRVELPSRCELQGGNRRE